MPTDPDSHPLAGNCAATCDSPLSVNDEGVGDSTLFRRRGLFQARLRHIRALADARGRIHIAGRWIDGETVGTAFDFDHVDDLIVLEYRNRAGVDVADVERAVRRYHEPAAAGRGERL